MAKYEKKRSEIEEKDKWNLDLIYGNKKEYEKDYKKAINNLKQFKKYQKKLLTSSKMLDEFITNFYAESRLINKLYMYAHLNYDTDTSNDYYKTLYGQINNLDNEFSNQTAFVMPELLEGNYKTVKSFYKEIPNLRNYDIYFKEVYRYQKHTLSKEEEKILSLLSTSFIFPEKVHSDITDTDLKFGLITDESGEDIELTDRNYSKYISSTNREVRREAFKTLYAGYKGVINTLSSLYYEEVDLSNKLADLKHYGSALEMSLYDDNVSPKVYKNLIDEVTNNLDALFEYYRLRKSILNLDELHLYDIYAPLVGDSQKEYTFSEAKEIVLKALEPLGADYISNVNKAFDERWIDIYSNEYKRSGAYSSGSYDTKPYLLLNFQGKLNDISTLAHELGHSMHSHYSNKNNPYQTSSYKIFVAEVASTVNELLLAKYLFKVSTSKKEKMQIINSLLDLFKSTIFRQTMFAEFEKVMHDRASNKEVLTNKLISDTYYAINEKYFGKDVIIDEDIRYEWSRIPHFYYSFYVYKYATGLSAACYIVNNILAKKENALDNYIKFLKSGGKDFPIDLLKIAGVDMNDKKVVQSAINMFKDLVEEFKALYYS